MMAPQKELRLASSETAITTMTVIATFRKNCQVILATPNYNWCSSMTHCFTSFGPDNHLAG